MPVYVPRELIHAAGMLPVGLLGGGDQLEVIQGDAYYQSYICRIPRSTIELGLTGRLDCLDGMLFPSICDVIRNLSGMWQILFKDKYVRYIDVPQNYVDAIGGTFYIQEMQVLRDDLGKPYFVFYGTVAERVAALGIANVHLSITHDAGIAAAVVVCEA